LWWYWFKQYALAPFFPRLGSVQLGNGPDQPPSVRPRDFEQQTAAPDLEVVA
jgi:hypothetical protein